MENKLNLPFITKDFHGIGGTIKKKPDHFIVEEVPLYDPSGEGNHLYLNITKKNMTSIEVQEKVSTILEINKKNIGFAGLKDKEAVTTQYYSIPINHKENIKNIINKIKKNIDIKINSYKRHKNKIKPGHLLGNKFKIIISDLKIDKKIAIQRTKRIIENIKKIGLPNYFGLQRFGINQNNIQKGLNLIKGKITIKDRWLKRFLISSYQSYLCNLYLAERIKKNKFNKLIKGDVVKKYDTGGLFEVEDLKTDQKRYDNKEISFTAPIYGTKMWDAKDESKKFEDMVLKKSDITLKDLEKNKIKGTRRTGRIIIKEIKIRQVKDGIKLEFFLPKGSFATVLLREIMKD